MSFFRRSCIPLGLDRNPPPGWLTASISLLGANLAAVPHPGTRVTGIVISDIGGILLIWIEIEDDDDAGDDSGS